MRGHRRALAFALLAWLPACSTPPDATTLRTRAALASLPAPTEAGGFSFELDVAIHGCQAGWMRMSATAGTGPDGQPVWELVDEQEILGVREITQETVDAGLVSLRGRHESLPAGGPGSGLVTSWTRTPEGYAWSVSRDGRPPERESSRVPEGGTATEAAMLLFCLALPDTVATYELRRLQPDAATGEARTSRGLVEVRGFRTRPDATGERRVWTVWRGDAHFDFDPSTRRLIGATSDTAQEWMTFVEGGQSREPPQLDLARPATAPRMAAARVLVALACGDAALLDDSVDWTGFELRLVRSGVDAATASGRRARMLSGMTPKPELQCQHTRVLLACLLDAATESLLDDGDVLVDFPEPMDEADTVLHETDGVWKMVDLPRLRGERRPAGDLSGR